MPSDSADVRRGRAYEKSCDAGNVRCEVTCYGDVAVARLKDRAYHTADSDSGDFQKALENALGESPSGLMVIDFHLVDIIGTGPIAKIITTSKKAAANNGRVVLAGMNEACSVVYDILSLARFGIPKFPDVAAGIGDLSAESARIYAMER